MDNLLEIVGGALLTWGIDVVAGRGPAILCAAVCVILVAEFSWAEKVWSVAVPQPRRRLVASWRKLRRRGRP